MPSVAYDADDKKLAFAARAGSSGNYVCPDCRVDVSYVSSHKRGKDTQVRAFFRYYQCPHRGEGSVSEPKDGAGGPGGGGGEDDKHKKRKYDALNEALAVFPAAEYALEEPITNSETGETRRPDAKLVFATPDEKYGKGLVIEYQNKNESKDREAVQKFFAQEEYTTIWLWDGQFDYTGQSPDIDLMGGEVYTPWPDAVPKQSEWRDIGFARKQLKRWEQASELGVKSVEVPATTVRKWFIPTQEQYWKGDYDFVCSWRAIDHFTYLPRWKERFPDYDGYPADHYRLQAAIPIDDISLQPPPKLHFHWWQFAKSIGIVNLGKAVLDSF